jgi:glycosyltransferase involved in cell wall biosynthesis
VEGVHIHRVNVDKSHNFFHWVANMNSSMGQHGGKLLLEEGPFDLVHAHDWLVADAAIALKHAFKIPLVATIHATEHGRFNGIYSEQQRYVSHKEAILSHEAWRIIVCTNYMRLEIERVLSASWDKIDVVYNGIYSDKAKRPNNANLEELRRHFAQDHEKIVYYVGRMTYEKGVSVLLSAVPKILWEMGDNVKFVLIGTGNTDEFKRQAWESGIWHKCYFTGFMSDEDLNQFRFVADCAAFPSLYEPFGIVVLENFAARVPVVVSDAGGLPEIVRHGRTGLVTWTNDANSLAWGILEILKNPSFAQQLADSAYEDLDRRFAWDKLAQQTDAVYGRILHERAQIDW